MGKGGPMSFLNKKTWHPGRIQNLEEVWKREQEAAKEEQRLKDLQKQIAEERAREELHQVAEAAGHKIKSDRLDWMYQGGVMARAEADQRIDAQAAAAGAAAAAAPEQQQQGGGVPGGGGPSLPSFYAEDTPVAANEVWQRLHSDPLFAIKQQEAAARRSIVANPVKMQAIKQQVHQLKELAGKAGGEKHKDKKHKKEKKQKKEKKEKKKRREASSSDDSGDERAAKRHRSASPRQQRPMPERGLDSGPGRQRDYLGGSTRDGPYPGSGREEQQGGRAGYGGDQRGGRQREDSRREGSPGRRGRGESPRRREGSPERRRGGSPERRRRDDSPRGGGGRREEREGDWRGGREGRREEGRGGERRGRDRGRSRSAEGRREERRGGERRDRSRSRSRSAEHGRGERERERGGGEGRRGDQGREPPAGGAGGKGGAGVAVHVDSASAQGRVAEYGLNRGHLPEAVQQQDRSDFAEQTRRRLEEAAKRKEAEEREKAAQRYVRREYVPGRLSEAERAKRLAEMAAAADDHEAARGARLQAAAAREQEEEAEQVGRHHNDTAAFLAKASKDVYGTTAGGSLEDRVGRRKFFSERREGGGSAFRK